VGGTENAPRQRRGTERKRNRLKREEVAGREDAGEEGRTQKHAIEGREE